MEINQVRDKISINNINNICLLLTEEQQEFQVDFREIEVPSR